MKTDDATTMTGSAVKASTKPVGNTCSIADGSAQHAKDELRADSAEVEKRTDDIPDRAERDVAGPDAGDGELQDEERERKLQADTPRYRPPPDRGGVRRAGNRGQDERGDPHQRPQLRRQCRCETEGDDRERHRDDTRADAPPCRCRHRASLPNAVSMPGEAYPTERRGRIAQ